MSKSAASQNRVIRVCVSSIFRDMDAERDELFFKIFPQLRRLCEDRAVMWEEIDLSRGTTEEQAQTGEVLPICLEEIKHCRPYFIGLLGERYGRISDAISSQVLEVELWIREYAQCAGKNSVSELDIMHWVINNPEMADHVFFYFRGPTFSDRLPTDQRKEDFVSEDEESRWTLKRLKDDIRQRHNDGRLRYEPRENFVDARALGEQVLADFTSLIDALFPTTEPISIKQLRTEQQPPVVTHSNVIPPNESTCKARPIDHVDENVQFTVYRPKSIRPEKWYPLLVYAHLDALPEDAEEEDQDPVRAVQEDAARTFGTQLNSFANETHNSFYPIPREGELTFVPEMKGAEFNPTRQTIRWMENYQRVEFRVRSSSVHDGENLRGRMSVFLGAILLADVALRIRVDSSINESRESVQTQSETATRYRKIFASYSHRDLAIVEQFEKYMETLGDRYLRDWKELRSGEHWNDRLMQLIEEADVFQLFWSRNSMYSPFVRQEWEYALRLKNKGTSFVRPTYWEVPFPDSPDENLPPNELRAIQFTRLGVTVPAHHSVSVQKDSSAAVSTTEKSADVIADVELQTDYREEARVQLQLLAEQMMRALAEFDISKARALTSEWRKVARSIVLSETDPLSSFVAPVLNWVEERDQAEREQANVDAALAALIQALDERADRDVLNSHMYRLECSRHAIPDAVIQRLNTRYLELDSASYRRRSNAGVAIVLLCAVAVAGLTTMIISNRTHQSIVAREEATLRHMLSEFQLSEAFDYLSALEASQASIAMEPAIQELEHELQIVWKNDTPRRAEFQRQMNDAQNNGVENPSMNTIPLALEAISKASKLARQPSEKAAVKDLEKAFKNAQKNFLDELYIQLRNCLHYLLDLIRRYSPATAPHLR